MKRLNITKEQFNRSRYFQRKYGKLEYVSESGKLFKTNKGQVLKFNESIRDIGYGVQDWGSTVYVEPLGAEMSWEDVYFIVRHDCSIYPRLEKMVGVGPREKPTDDMIRSWIEKRPKEFVEYLKELGAYNDNFDGDQYDDYEESTKKFKESTRRTRRFR